MRVLVWNLVMLSSDEQGVRESPIGELDRMEFASPGCRAEDGQSAPGRSIPTAKRPDE